MAYSCVFVAVWADSREGVKNMEESWSVLAPVSGITLVMGLSCQKQMSPYLFFLDTWPHQMQCKWNKWVEG